MRWSKWSTAVSLVVLLLLLAGASAYGHQIADGNARVEIVHEPTYPPAVERVESDLYDANPAIRVGGWSWAAVSMTDPQLGDCHDGTTNPTYLRALRFGWIKDDTMLAPELMVAWITYYDTVEVRTYGDYPSFATLEIKINTSNPSQHYWDFRRNGSKIETVYNGPNAYLKCVTFGGWTSSFNNAIGNAEFVDVMYSLYGGAGGIIEGNPAHSVRNNPYNFSVSGVLQRTYNFYGNN